MKKRLFEIEPVGVSVLHGKDMLICLVRQKDGRFDLAYYIQEGSVFKEHESISIRSARGTRERYGSCREFRASRYAGTHVLNYIRRSGKKNILVTATSKDGLSWKILNEDEAYGSLAIVSQYAYKGEYVGYGSPLQVGFGKRDGGWRFSQILIPDALQGFVPSASSSRILGALRTPQGILLIYDRVEIVGKRTNIIIGAMICSSFSPYRVTWATQQPLWKHSLAHAVRLDVLGMTSTEQSMTFYWTSSDGRLVYVTLPIPYDAVKAKSTTGVTKLSKFQENPVIAPKPHSTWESVATFNPAALYIDGKIRILYRAQGGDGISYLGYAESEDGYAFKGRQKLPAYWPRTTYEGVARSPTQEIHQSESGGGWGGCEDPRLTLIDDTVYVVYIAYDAWRPQRIAVSSISKEDFLKKRWHKWSWPVIASDPRWVDKNGALLSEKIGGKYVFFHRIFPNILVDFVDSLEFGEGKWLPGEHKIEPRPSTWDSRKVGIGPPPLKTEVGWLMIYQAVDDRRDSEYNMGAMLLDLKDPTKVLHRTAHPILVPDTHYENKGLKSGVAYPCGAVIKDGTLFVYYGGSDTFVCVATAPLKEFLYNLQHEKNITFTLKSLSLS